MNNTAAKTTKELASRSWGHNDMIGGRTMTTYLRANGAYAVRLYLPAGECVANEVVYAYFGKDVSEARAAWRRVVAQWDALYAKHAAAA